MRSQGISHVGPSFYSKKIVMKIKATTVKQTIEGFGDVEVLRLGFKADLKVVDEKDDRWIIEGYASVFGNVDSYYEIVDKGAFTDFLAKYPADPTTGVPRFPKFIWGHDWGEPLGPTLEAREDEIGLFVRGELLKEVQRSREVYALIKSGALTDMSFGFRVLEDEFDHETGYRHLKKIDIFEWSPVLVGANPAATITGSKSLELKEAGIDSIPAEAVIKFKYVKDNGEAVEDAEPDGQAHDAEPVVEETPAPVDPVAETPAVAEDEGSEVEPEVETPVVDTPVPDDAPIPPESEDEKSGRTLSSKTRKSIEKSVSAMTAAGDAIGQAGKALEALLKAADEDGSEDSDTGVESKREGGGSDVVRLILRDARQAVTANQKVVIRAKSILSSE
jgi:HK97 family phage prohead protease